VTAERSKRAEILESEGQRQSAINIAEGRKQSVILASEALKSEQINTAAGEAEAITLKATATARGIDSVSASIEKGGESAQGALSLRVAEQYVDAFGKLAKEGTSVVVPGNVGDMGQMIATAMGVFKTVGQSQARTVAGKLVQGESKQEGNAESKSESSGDHKNNEVVKSVLESFEKTQQKH
jgi:hypothetical protein